MGLASNVALDCLHQLQAFVGRAVAPILRLLEQAFQDPHRIPQMVESGFQGFFFGFDGLLFAFGFFELAAQFDNARLHVPQSLSQVLDAQRGHQLGAQHAHHRNDCPDHSSSTECRKGVQEAQKMLISSLDKYIPISVLLSNTSRANPLTDEERNSPCLSV